MLKGTSYGSLQPSTASSSVDFEEGLTHGQISSSSSGGGSDSSDYGDDSSESSTKCNRALLLSAGLVMVGIAAVSASQLSGKNILTGVISKKSTRMDTTADGTTVERPVYANLEDYEKEAIFRSFVTSYNKMYKTDEYETKFGWFKTFLSVCDARNMAEAAAGGSAVHGVTKFADLSSVEFENYLGYTATTKTLTPEYPTVATYTGSDAFVDWTDKYTTAVKDQGYCASCWAFAAAAQIESDAIRLKGITTSDTVSAQQFVSCDSTDSGCSGGDPSSAYQYVMDTGGVVAETSYPYTADLGTVDSCSSTSMSEDKFYIQVDSYSSLKGNYETEVEVNMMNYVKSTGPLVACLDASEWSSYISGVISVCPTDASVVHCVQVVGVNTDDGYWKLRNSWGSDWGEDGFIRLAYGSNTCSITSDPSFTTVSLYGVTDAPTLEPTPEPSSYAPSPEPTADPTRTDDYWDDDGASNESNDNGDTDDWDDDWDD